MEILKAILLGIIQGLTEFLPVSSSGHLEIFKCLVSSNVVATNSLLMTVVLHFATALSTIFVFRREIHRLIIGLIRFDNNEEFFFSIKILLSMIPAIFVGIVFESQIEKLFQEQLILVGGMLIITGFLLFFSDKIKVSEKNITIRYALIIGLAQAIAILPGISRSGATISTSILLGINKDVAARFSFLMVVPLIIGKMLRDIFSGEISINDTAFLPLVAGFIFAFLTGLIACKWMIQLIKNSQLKYFSFYCFGLGIVVILFFINNKFPCQI